MSVDGRRGGMDVWRRKDGDTSRYVPTTCLPELSVDAKYARVQVPCRRPQNLEGGI